MPSIPRNPTPVVEKLEAAVDRARRSWQQVRLHHAIGSPEEPQYWDAYRLASDRLWAYRRQDPFEGKSNE